jgi:hypothetical protein
MSGIPQNDMHTELVEQFSAHYLKPDRHYELHKMSREDAEKLARTAAEVFEAKHEGFASVLKSWVAKYEGYASAGDEYATEMIDELRQVLAIPLDQDETAHTVTALGRVIALAAKWEKATEMTTGNPSIVARAFAAELRTALAGG